MSTSTTKRVQDVIAEASFDEEISPDTSNLLKEQTQLVNQFREFCAKGLSGSATKARELQDSRNIFIQQIAETCIRFAVVGSEQKEATSKYHQQVMLILSEIKRFDVKASEAILSAYLGSSAFKSVVEKNPLVHHRLLDMASDALKDQNPGLFALMCKLYFENASQPNDFRHLQQKLTELSMLMANLKDTQIAQDPGIVSVMSNAVIKMSHEYIDIELAKLLAEKIAIKSKGGSATVSDAKLSRPAAAELKVASHHEAKSSHDCEIAILQNIRTIHHLSRDPAERVSLEKQYFRTAKNRETKLFATYANVISENIFRIFGISKEKYLTLKPSEIEASFSRPAQLLLNQLFGKELTIADIRGMAATFDFSSLTSRFPGQNQALKEVLTKLHEQIIREGEAFPFLTSSSGDYKYKFIIPLEVERPREKPAEVELLPLSASPAGHDTTPPPTKVEPETR